MTRASIIAHLRRYPRWYTAGVAWAVLLIVLPVIEIDPLDAFSSDPPAQPATSLGPAGEAGLMAPADPGPTAAPPAPRDTVTEAPGPAAPPATGEPSADVAAPIDEIPPELVEPDPLDLVFDLLPPPQATPVPPELEGVARAVAPVATYGCSGIGLASIVIAVVAPTVDGIPLERILPYLAPATTACAAFPIPAVHTVCEADEPFIIDLGGLTKTPPILGLGIDQLDALETVMADTFGQGFPRLAPTLRELLTCELVET